MSLLLRQQCQPILDEAGLSKLNIGLQSNTMAIKGECGQTILTIGGIQFSTKNPKQAEIAYALELFQKFIDKHAAKILEFIALNEQYKSELDKLPVLSTEKYSSSINAHTPKNSYIVVRGALSIYIDGRFSTNRSFQSIDELIEEYNTHAPIIAEYFKAKEATDALADKANAARQALTTCNI